MPLTTQTIVQASDLEKRSTGGSTKPTLQPSICGSRPQARSGSKRSWKSKQRRPRRRQCTLGNKRRAQREAADRAEERRQKERAEQWVEEWLESFGLQHLAELLLENEFNRVSLAQLGASHGWPQIMQMLKEIGVEEASLKLLAPEINKHSLAKDEADEIDNEAPAAAMS